jgi:hypothetical protein
MEALVKNLNSVFAVWKEKFKRRSGYISKM